MSVESQQELARAGQLPLPIPASRRTVYWPSNHLSRSISSAAAWFWKFSTKTSLVLKESHYYFLHWNEIWERKNAGEEEWVHFPLRNKLGDSDKSSGICSQKTRTCRPSPAVSDVPLQVSASGFLSVKRS